jgi:AraC-like DNA-binding protein
MLAELATAARLGPCHFARAFKRSLCRRSATTRSGASNGPRAYWQPTLSITEISLAIGFSQANSFTATFRRLVGCTTAPIAVPFRRNRQRPYSSLKWITCPCYGVFQCGYRAILFLVLRSSAV